MNMGGGGSSAKTNGAVYLPSVFIFENPNSRSLSAYLSINFLAFVGYILGRLSIKVLLGSMSIVIGSALAGWLLPSLIQSVSLDLHKIDFSRLDPLLNFTFSLARWIACSISSCI